MFEIKNNFNMHAINLVTRDKVLMRNIKPMLVHICTRNDRDKLFPVPTKCINYYLLSVSLA